MTDLFMDNSLEALLHQAPPKYFTLGWLISNLQQRSFGAVVLFLGLLATTPVGSTVPGLTLAAVALQMITGRRESVFPKCITTRSLTTRYLIRVAEHAIPVMQYLENAVHPRWPTAFEATKRFVGVVVLLLTAALPSNPGPLEQHPTGDCDRGDFPCISGGRWTAALLRPSCGDKRRVSGSLGNDSWRRLYQPNMVAIVKHTSGHAMAHWL
jgi:hypothetical protein